MSVADNFRQALEREGKPMSDADLAQACGIRLQHARSEIHRQVKLKHMHAVERRFRGNLAQATMYAWGKAPTGFVAPRVQVTDGPTITEPARYASVWHYAAGITY